MTVEIRVADPTEYAAVGRLTRDAYAASGYLVAEADYADHLLDAASRAADAELYVAVLDGDVVGTVTFCSAGSPWSELAGPQDGEFRMLAVASSGRRKGVAAALVRTCIDRSLELGFSSVVLCSMPVQVEAQRIYARFGFRRTPEKDWSPAPGVDLLGFRLDL